MSIWRHSCLIDAISGESGGGDSTTNVTNTITYYVDSNYTGSVTNGSILHPSTKIQDALNGIGTDDQPVMRMDLLHLTLILMIRFVLM